jgi:glycosyltransferase involved in cell wall biosynthesis
MKIAFITNSIGNPGGMERVLCTKANYFCDVLDYEVSILVKNPLPEDLFFDFSTKINFYSFNESETYSSRYLLIFNRNYKKLLEEYLCQNKQDIVIGMFGHELPFLYLINDESVKIQEFHYSKNYLVHLVTNLSKTNFRTLKKCKAITYQWMQRIFAKKYDALVLLTKKDQSLWGSNFETYVIPNPISFRSVKKSSLENKKIIAAGRLTAQKGFVDLILAYSRIHKYIDDWTLDIYGEGQDFFELNSMVQELNLDGKIKILPPLKNIQTALFEASFLVFPSKYEGFGLVLIEAMECGIPTIAYDCECGPSEIICDGKDGFLVPYKDVDFLSHKILELALDYKKRLEFGRNAIENVKAYQMDRIGEEWNNLFKKLTPVFQKTKVSKNQE